MGNNKGRLCLASAITKTPGSVSFCSRMCSLLMPTYNLPNYTYFTSILTIQLITINAAPCPYLIFNLSPIRIQMHKLHNFERALLSPSDSELSHHPHHHLTPLTPLKPFTLEKSYENHRRTLPSHLDVFLPLPLPEEIN